MSGLSFQNHGFSTRNAMHATRILLPVMLNLTTAALSLYGAVRFAMWTWAP